MKPALKIEGISKQYRLGHVGVSSLRDDLLRLLAGIQRSPNPFLSRGETNDRSRKSEEAYVWALKDIDFSVNPGEVLGVIGKNGAGKSTLLKILSRITAPTTGEVEVNGRMASLLEVGTGFHPELTGRENIYLNGAILGMRKAEIKSKFDEIVDFSGVERYIDTPVKRYSSGMYVRLAFAVAAHLEPEILVVDEVLAVGDLEFQKKCLGKLKNVTAEKGRTVLFVSHNMTAIQTLCNSAILLKNGKIKSQGRPAEIISQYADEVAFATHHIFSPPLELPFISLISVCLVNENTHAETSFFENNSFKIQLNYQEYSQKQQIDFTFHLLNGIGEAVCSFSTATGSDKIKSGKGYVEFIFPPYFFQAGQFSFDLFVVANKNKAIFHKANILSFNVVEVSRILGEYLGREPGSIRPQIETKFFEN